MPSTENIPARPTGPARPAALINEKDAAAFLAMSVHYLRQARVKGRGPAYARFGRSIRYRPADLDAWLSTHMVRRGQ